MENYGKQLELTLAKKLKNIWDDYEFVIGVLNFAETDEERLVIMEYLDSDEDITPSRISILAYDLYVNGHEKWYQLWNIPKDKKYKFQ